MATLQSLLDPDAQRTLRGTLERVVFHNEENGYTVMRMRVQSKADPVTVVGSMPSPQPGIGLTVTGVWVTDNRFGRQFKMESFETLLPATLEGIKHYLGSGLIKGVGKALAGRIVDAFGEDTFTVLDDDPDRLTRVKGITPRLVSDIKAAWAEHKGIRDLIMFLQPHGVSTSYAVRIFRHYGADALAVVKENPYRLQWTFTASALPRQTLLPKSWAFCRKAPCGHRPGCCLRCAALPTTGTCFIPLKNWCT